MAWKDANIVLPFGVQVKKELADTAGLSIDYIAPSHGLIWRSFIKDIAAKYTDWSAGKVDESGFEKTYLYHIKIQNLHYLY